MKIVNNKLKGREQAKNVYDNIQKFFFFKKKKYGELTLIGFHI